MAFTEAEESAFRGILAIYQTQAPSLSADVAELATALFEPWSGDGRAYGASERVSYGGALYVCLQSHTSQPNWAPLQAPSLWAKNLSVEGGSGRAVPEWEQPGASNGYALGSIVAHAGKTWQSLVANNVWEPGVTGTETLWKEVVFG